MVYLHNICRKPWHIVVCIITLICVSILQQVFFSLTSHSFHRSNGRLRDSLYFKDIPELKSRNKDSHSELHNVEIHLIFIFFHTSQNSRLVSNLQQCLSSLLKNTKHHNLSIHVFGDEESFVSLESTLEELNVNIKPKIILHDQTSLQPTLNKLRDVHTSVAKVKHKFSSSFFYVSLFLHEIMPETITKVIVLDTDILVQSDIEKLYELFNDFNDKNIIGIAHENQPTYRYMFYEFRRENPGTRVGEPPPHGLTGFNSGVVLVDLKKMRKSREYTNLLSNETLRNLARKYKFQGNLGDQDVFTIMSLEHEHLFYVLPCGWNRQLCRWWQKADFENIFDNYFSCKEKIHILHGNCQTGITPIRAAVK